jgi:hypothetical protein
MGDEMAGEKRMQDGCEFLKVREDQYGEVWIKYKDKEGNWYRGEADKYAKDLIREREQG